MGILHKTLSGAIKILNMPKPVPIDQVKSDLRGHIAALRAEFKSMEVLETLLKQYYAHLEKAMEVMEPGGERTEPVKEHVESARALVAKIEAAIRMIYGETHKFLE